ncbi:MAG TPA: histidine phosphatase family protein, partial [Mycobacterium sp.]
MLVRGWTPSANARRSNWRLASSRRELHVDAVITSRAARAEQTGRIVAEALGTSVDETTCDLCEMHPGRAEGLTPEEMRETFGPTYAEVPGAEHWPDWLPGAATRLAERGRRHQGETILAFTHYGVI